jgi:hypothetical protein
VRPRLPFAGHRDPRRSLLPFAGRGALAAVADALLPDDLWWPGAAGGLVLAAVIWRRAALRLPGRARPAEASQPPVRGRRPSAWSEPASGYGPTPEYQRLLAEGRARYRRDAARFAPFPPADDNRAPAPDPAFDAFAAAHGEPRP